MAIGQELLDIPFADMIRNLAVAIAEGQLALDRSSIETLKFLMENNVSIVPEIAEIIEPAPREVEISPGNKVTVTGVNIRASGAPPMTLSLLQAGLQPTFYQFTEATIEVKLSISIKRTEESQPASGGDAGPTRLFSQKTRAFASAVNYRTSNTYTYTANGSSTLRATMRPVPPPARLTPRSVVVNAFTSPPTVTVNG